MFVRAGKGRGQYPHCAELWSWTTPSQAANRALVWKLQKTENRISNFYFLLGNSEPPQ